MKKIDIIVGARPNYMKAAPVMRSLKDYDCEIRFIHTGQHYDKNMSEDLFRNLGLPKEDINFHVGSGNHADQTAKVMVAYQQATEDWRPDVTVVFGDVNSTLACALVSAKKGIKVAHVEAGCRSGDMSMPEEINRIMVDHISDYLFCVSYFDKKNLDKENVKYKKGRVVAIVGDTMIDSLKYCENRYSQSDVLPRLKLMVNNYILSTIHRPSNVDDEKRLSRLLDKIENVTKTYKIVFPMHPRTRKMIAAMERLDHLKGNPNFIITEPLDYFDFMQLQKNAMLLLTDSGSIQAEASAFGVPCLTLRRNTERPHTLVKHGGTNKLIGISPRNLLETINSSLSTNWTPKAPYYKDSGYEIARRIMD